MEQLVERAYETFAEEARRRSIDYRVDVNAQPVIVSDGDRVLQIVDNLLSNAFRATPDGGRIGLELAPDERDDRGSRSRTPGPGIAGRAARAALPAVRLRRGRRHRARARDRAGAVARRSAGGSSSTRRSGAARASSSLLPAERRSAGSRRRPARSGTTSAARVERALDPVEPLVERRATAPVIRSTSSARSSTRACRSTSRSVSSRSSRRIIWFERPLTSARRREIGAASSRSPSRSALPTASGRTTWSSSAVCASASTWSRARSSAAAMSGGSE